MMEDKKVWLKYAVSVCLCLAIFLPILELAHLSRIDDFLITMRYSRNAANGLGAVFNQGDYFQGFSSPLQFLSGIVLIKSGLGLETAPSAVNLIGLLGMAVSGFCFALWINGRFSILPTIVCCAFLLSSKLIFDFSGFDSVWMVGLAVLSLTFLCRRKYFAGGILAGLAVLARHDAGLLVVVIGIILLVQKEFKSLFRFSLAVGFITFPWYAWAWAYYGNPLPKTLSVKMAQGRDYSFWKNDFLKVAEVTKNAFFPNQISVLLGLLAFSLILAVVLTRRLGWRKAFQKAAGQPMVLFSIFGICHYIVYFWVLKVPADYPWYHVPAVAAILLVAAYGLASIGFFAEEIVIKEISQKVNVRSCLALFAVLPFVICVTGWFYASHYKEIRVMRAENPQGYNRYSAYYQAAHWLNDNISPGDTVRCPEIGVVGWYGHFDIEDAVGLVMNAPKGSESTARWFVVLGHDLYLPKRLVESGAQIIKSYSAEEQNKIFIFQCY